MGFILTTHTVFSILPIKTGVTYVVEFPVVHGMGAIHHTSHYSAAERTIYTVSISLFILHFIIF